MINDFSIEASQLFILMAPYLIMGLLISGLLYIFTSKEIIVNVKCKGERNVTSDYIICIRAIDLWIEREMSLTG